MHWVKIENENSFSDYESCLRFGIWEGRNRKLPSVPCPSCGASLRFVGWVAEPSSVLQGIDAPATWDDFCQTFGHLRMENGMRALPGHDIGEVVHRRIFPYCPKYFLGGYSTGFIIGEDAQIILGDILRESGAKVFPVELKKLAACDWHPGKPADFEEEPGDAIFRGEEATGAKLDLFEVVFPEVNKPRPANKFVGFGCEKCSWKAPIKPEFKHTAKTTKDACKLATGNGWHFLYFERNYYVSAIVADALQSIETGNVKFGTKLKA